MGICCDSFNTEACRLDKLHHNEDHEPREGEEKSPHPNTICHLTGHWTETDLLGRHHSLDLGIVRSVYRSFMVVNSPRILFLACHRGQLKRGWWVSVSKSITAQSVKDDMLLESGVQFELRASFKEHPTCGLSQTNCVYDIASLLKSNVSGRTVKHSSSL